MSINVDMSPILFTFGSTEVRWYGLMTALAILTVIIWTYFASKKAGIPSDVVFTGALWAIPFGLVVSHLVEVVDRLDYYTDNADKIFSFSGLTIFGAILGATLGVWISTRIKGQSFGQLADIAAPGVILGQAVGRVGCAINGCCYGTPTGLPWGFTYMNPDSFGPLGISTHPVVVYELMFDLAIFGMLLWLRRKTLPIGSLFLIYLATYSVGRFLLSYLRENSTYFGLKEAQLIAILVFVITVPILIYQFRQNRSEPLPIKADGDN